MVSPNENWEETDDGYRTESEFISVLPAIVRSSDGVSSHRAGGIPEDDANAYSVDVQSSSGSRDAVANFEDPRKAWEFANLLTHYFGERRSVWPDKSDLLHDPEFGEEPKEVPEIVSDYSAAEVLKRLIHPRPVPRDIEDIFAEAE